MLFRSLCLRNLIRNAIEHSPAASEVLIGVEESVASTSIIISDHGPGIPPAELQRIRQRFVRGSRAKGPGSGLGLSIVELVLERIGATLELRNNLPSGLTAYVRLPKHAVRLNALAAAPPLGSPA